MSLLSATILPVAVRPKPQLPAGPAASQLFSLNSVNSGSRSFRPFSVGSLSITSRLPLAFQLKGKRRGMGSRTSKAAEPTAELKVGDKLQDYPDYYRVLKSSDGKAVALSNFEGKKPVVLFFYPKAATPGCTKEVCKFRDDYSSFKTANAEVFGISGDSPEENKKFAEANRLPFPLLTDQGNFLRKSFGIKADLLGVLPGRQTYVIGKDGKVLLSYNNQFAPETHITQALAALKTA
eukprot:jgi/Botrbrau1/6158/Bobra.331_2s0048.1